MFNYLNANILFYYDEYLPEVPDDEDEDEQRRDEEREGESVAGEE